jgi:C1A family cysteine protease
VQLPEYKNWYEDGAVTRPRDQADCGSCWAFTTAATLESLAVISKTVEKPEEFSIQQLLDCDESNSGCDGGWMYKGYLYVSKTGIMKQEDYPY